jgi:HPt (histidine-containing phosphotransfer) domain-containing protein
MNRNEMCAGSHSPQTPTGQQALPRALVGGALGAPTLPAAAETSPISWANFAVLEALFPADDFRDLILLSLSDIALHLERIARLPAGHDIEVLAREAHAIGRAAGNLSAPQAQAMAHRLEMACQCGHQAATNRLIGELGRACGAADAILRGWLEKPILNARTRAASGPRS